MKKTLITGASSGIGLATARKLLSLGKAVSGVARSFEKTECDNLEKLILDLAELDKLAARLEKPCFKAADYDCLILNAGYGRFGGIEQFSHQQIRHLIDTNLVSNLYLIKHFLPEFKRSGAKDIILLGSESALAGAKQGAVYCASKFAIRGLAQSLRADCAKSDIRVMLVNPGPVASDFFDELHFEPVQGEDYSLSCEVVADAIVNALQQPRETVLEEINIQPMKRAFQKT